MNGVKFTRQNGGLKRELPGEDHISGLLVYGDTNIAPILINSAEDFLSKSPVADPAKSIVYYHICEFFRISPNAKLYVQAKESKTSDNTTYEEIKTLQAFANGSIRQLAIWNANTAYTKIDSEVSKINKMAKDLEALNTPLSILLTLKLPKITELQDLRTGNYERVSLVIGQDAEGWGNELADEGKLVVSCLGAALGAVAKAKVNESIAWVERQNMVSTAYSIGQKERARELDVLKFIDGTLLTGISAENLEDIHKKGYIFVQKHTGIVGSYFNDSFSLGKVDGDFAYLENNRTIDKATRAINRVLLPKISGPAYVDASNGKLSPATVVGLESLCDEAMDALQLAGEISGYKVTIDANQNVLTSSKLQVSLKLIPVGVMREIEVKIGLTLKK